MRASNFGVFFIIYMILLGIIGYFKLFIFNLCSLHKSFGRRLCFSSLLQTQKGGRTSRPLSSGILLYISPIETKSDNFLKIACFHQRFCVIFFSDNFWVVRPRAPALFAFCAHTARAFCGIPRCSCRRLLRRLWLV